MKSIIRSVAGRLASLLEGVAAVIGGVAIFVRSGPRGYARRRKAIRLAEARDGATFASGVTTTFTPQRAAGWHRLHWRPMVVAILGDHVPEGASTWIRDAHATLHAHFLVTAALAQRLEDVSPDIYTVAEGVDLSTTSDLAALCEWVHRGWRRNDLLLPDSSQPLPDTDAVIQLQHAAYEYHYDREIGIVVPAYLHDGRWISGFDIDRRSGAVVPAVGGRDYGQHHIPRYVLTAGVHGMYATAVAVDRVDVAEGHLAGLTLDEQAGRIVRRAWAGHVRTLCMASTAIPVREVPHLTLGAEQQRWQGERRVTDADGRTKVVFVLNATSISGGIRVVFELANGLAERGFDVAIWSLEGTPDWFDLRVPVRRYRTYEDLLLSLRRIDAIKVATWWETAEVVWLATVSHGLPVYLVQEFETWFYPDDPIAQAAVVATYRREFLTVTQASYQQRELADVGVHAQLIPIGYDERVFRPLPDVQREPDTILALGRSFFQKNFEMTRRAWLRLGDERPALLLFGSEPDLIDDERAQYAVRPSDAQVNVLYNRAAAFVQTSRHEGFCLPILEAMAAGCPVIVTDSHGNRDFCEDGRNCIIVPQDDDAALAAAISELLADPAKQERLRQAGLETARRYRWSVVLDETAELYRGLQSGSVPA